MDQKKMIFYRNLLVRAFLIGLVFGILFFVITVLFWREWTGWTADMFKVNEEESGLISLEFFVILRIVLIFIFLTPGLALHWVIMTSKRQAKRIAKQNNSQ